MAGGLYGAHGGRAQDSVQCSAGAASRGEQGRAWGTAAHGRNFYAARRATDPLRVQGAWRSPPAHSSTRSRSALRRHLLACRSPGIRGSPPASSRMHGTSRFRPCSPPSQGSHATVTRQVTAGRLKTASTGSRMSRCTNTRPAFAPPTPPRSLRSSPCRPKPAQAGSHREVGGQNTRLAAGWDDDYLLRMTMGAKKQMRLLCHAP